MRSFLRVVCIVFYTDRSTLFVQKTVAKRFKPPVTGLLTARKGAMRRTIPTNKWPMKRRDQTRTNVSERAQKCRILLNFSAQLRRS
jgi:ribosomal protein L35